MRYRFNVCDLNAIETRVGAWLAECHDLMEVFRPYTDAKGNYWRNGKDPYLSFASRMFALPYEKLWADYQGWNGKEAKAAAKRMRQVAKPGVLGAIYRLSGGLLMYVFKCTCRNREWLLQAETAICQNCGTECSPRYTKKTGLWDYADKMGVEMSQEQSGEVVEIFRNSYPEICNSSKSNGLPLGIWKRLEEAVADVMDPARLATVRHIGPNNCVKIDRINVEGRHPIMRMQLPSGRYLHYIDAHLKSTLMPWKGTDEDGEECDIYRDALVYAGTNQKTKQWEVNITTHGGKLFENLVQGIARDILGWKMLEVESRECETVGHVHDEQICLVEDDLLSFSVDEMVEIFSSPISWAPGLLLGADGFESKFYRK
jgi:DNA polymerase